MHNSKQHIDIKDENINMDTLKLRVHNYLNKKKKISPESFAKNEYTITKLDKLVRIKADKTNKCTKRIHDENGKNKHGDYEKYHTNSLKKLDLSITLIWMDSKNQTKRKTHQKEYNFIQLAIVM